MSPSKHQFAGTIVDGPEAELPEEALAEQHRRAGRTWRYRTHHAICSEPGHRHRRHVEADTWGNSVGRAVLRDVDDVALADIARLDHCPEQLGRNRNVGGAAVDHERRAADTAQRYADVMHPVARDQRHALDVGRGCGATATGRST